MFSLARDRIISKCPEVKVTPDHHAAIMRLAFSQIHDPNDWKAPIHALVPISMVGIYRDAIRFMTATEPETYLTEKKTHDGMELIRILSQGYRAGPAGG